MAEFPSGSGLLDTPQDWHDCGWGHGFTGHTAESALAHVRRECGDLDPWQEAALLAGLAVGREDAEGYRRDMEAAPPIDWSGVPY